MIISKSILVGDAEAVSVCTTKGYVCLQGVSRAKELHIHHCHRGISFTPARLIAFRLRGCLWNTLMMTVLLRR